MVMALRALVATLLAALVVAAATGCGTETVGVEEIAKAADASERTTGMRVALEATIDGPQGDVDMTGSGVMDMMGRRGELTYRFQGQEMRQVMDRFVMYMKSPQFEPALGEGKEWAKIDLERSSKELGVDLGAVQQPGSGDPRQMFSQLKAMSGEIERVGNEDVRGVQTTHYSGDVEIDNLHRGLPPDRQEAARRSIERVKEVSGLKDYPLDVWIDEDDRVRRMRMAMEMEILEQDIAFDLTMEFYDYGTRVSIDVPPEDEVEDLTELAARGASAFGGAGGAP
jgi:hypothetical protein